MMTPYHIPVLCNEAMHYLNPRFGGRYVDATVGSGGHTLALLRRSESSKVLGIDKDIDVIKLASQRLQAFTQRVHLVHSSYTSIHTILDKMGWSKVDGILADLGVSSIQIDTAARGFSYLHQGPLDMRMDCQQQKTAADILNTASKTDLIQLLQKYGELRQSRRLAEAIIAFREQNSWRYTTELVDLINRILPKGKNRRHSLVPRCFQAFRIAVNNELTELRHFLTRAIQLLKSGGRLIIISFHSLEDRMVKQSFRKAENTCICPPEFPFCQCNHHSMLRILTPKAIQCSEEEKKQNGRAAAAKLRAAEKI